MLSLFSKSNLFNFSSNLIQNDFIKPKLANPEIQSSLKYNGPSKEEVMSLREKYLSPGLILYYKNPVFFVEGKMQYLFDDKGKRYLDCFAGIVTVSVGHCHPKIVEAGQKQMETLMHTTNIYLNNEIAEYGKELSDKLPPHLNSVFFTNSGSEANDLAVLMSRMYTDNIDFISLRNGYHGGSNTTSGLTGQSCWKFSKSISIGNHHALNPDTYRGPFKKSDPEAASKYAWDVQNLIEHGTSGHIAGFIHETIQGVGGSVEMPDGYLNKVYDSVHKHGGVCIADEVQTGFGRTGEKYWGFETKNVKPDIVTMAKGIGNGIPLGAVVTSKKIAQTLKEKHFFNTFGGNPISSAIGRAVLKVIDEEKLQDNCKIVGDYFFEQLKKLQNKYPNIIGDIRGKGLMIGMELIKDKKTLEPATEETAQIFEMAKDMGVLLGKGGIYGNVFRIKPPMCFNKDNVDEVVYVLDKCFQKLKL